MAQQPQIVEGPLTMDEAADGIANLPNSLLGLDEPDEQEPQDTAGETSEEEAEQPVEAEDAEADDASDDTEAEPEGEDEGEETDDATEAATDGDDPIYEVTLPGGQTMDVPLSELVNGYSREQDYTQKTQGLSAKEQEIVQERGQIQQLQQHYIQQLQATLQAPALQPPPLDLLDEDPMEYQRQRAYYDSAKDERAQQEEALRIETERAQEVNQRQQADTLAWENAAIVQIWPEFGDPEKAPALQSNMRTGLTEQYGFTADELNSLSDHRLVHLARDALRYKGQQKATAGATVKLKSKPTPVKPGASETRRNRGQARHNTKRTALRKSGDLRDAAAAIEDLL